MSVIENCHLPGTEVASNGKFLDTTWPTKHKLKPDFEAHLQRHVSHCLSLRSRPKFPGTQPVSLNSGHLQRLKPQKYYISEKSDGCRYLMYLTPAGPCSLAAYLIDRRNEFFSLDTALFSFRTEDQSQLKDTLLDGELVLETGSNSTHSESDYHAKFLVFDCLLYDGRSCTRLPFHKRLQKARNAVQSLLNHDSLSNDTTRGRFSIEVKTIKPTSQLPKLLEQVIPSLHHSNDGIIFTPVHMPYICGVNDNLLKWKPKNLVTVDFRLFIDDAVQIPPRPHSKCCDIGKDLLVLSERRPPSKFASKLGPLLHETLMPKFHLLLYAGKGEYKCFGEMALAPHVLDKWKEGSWRNNDIVECTYDGDGKWQYVQTRTDKSDPNSIKTAMDIMKTLKNDIQVSELVAVLRDDKSVLTPSNNNGNDNGGRRKKKKGEKAGKKEKEGINFSVQFKHVA